MRAPNYFSIVAIAVLALSTLPLAEGSRAKLERCDPNATSSSCPKAQYCLAAKPHSYCTEKLDGGKECTKDDACKSDICFIAKVRNGKRVCASLPLSNYPLGAQCTQSKQCKSGYCGKGFCKKPVAAGESCSKDVACAEKSKGAKCIKKPATFVVYDSAGKKHTKKLSAGKCSYISNLGEDSTCSSNANCYSKKFTCSKKTKKCTAIAAPSATDLPYQHKCSADTECSSGSCVKGKCGCAARGSDCDAGNMYCSSDATCQELISNGQTCDEDYECYTGICTAATSASRSLDKRVTPKICGCADSSTCGPGQYCNDQTNLCNPKRPYSENCSLDSQCRSGKCNGDFTCGCLDDSSAGGSDCDQDTEFCRADATCKPKLGYGSACIADAQCKDDFCVSPSLFLPRVMPGPSNICGCSSDSTCNPSSEFCEMQFHLCTHKLYYGDSCSSSSQCRSDRCRLTEDSTCGCSADSQCPGSQVCDQSTYKCGVAPTTNLPYLQPCDTDDNCASRSCVNAACGCSASGSDCDADSEFCSADATCQSKLAYGEVCSKSQQCMDDARCVSSELAGRSIDKRVPPSATICGCTSDSACVSDELFCDGADSQLCLPKSPAGYPCSMDNVCISNVCFEGTQCGCSADSDCNAASEFCAADGQCKLKNGLNSLCDRNAMCRSGSCRSNARCGCTADVQCNGGTCDLGQGLCFI